MRSDRTRTMNYLEYTSYIITDKETITWIVSVINCYLTYKLHATLRAIYKNQALVRVSNTVFNK